MIEFKSIAPSALRTSEAFKTLMPFDMRVVELLAKSMKKDGWAFASCGGSDSGNPAGLDL